MDILKTATDWAKAELLSNGVFLLFGALFLASGFALFQMGRSEMARAYVIPTLVAGVLLLIIGGGLMYGTWKSLAGFAPAFASDAPAFVAAEIARIDKTMAQYGVAVFKVMPLIVMACAALIIVLNGPVWRASLITTIALVTAIMLVDSTAHARLEDYKTRLLSANAPQ